MTMLVGGPVLKRAWVVADSVRHARQACAHAGVEPEFLFVGAEWDTDTWAAIDAGAGGAPVHRVYVDEPRTVDRRDWKPQRYHRMVELRNRLLAEVRALAPEWFLSLDSDILLEERAVANGLEDLARFDAVALACYLAPGLGSLNYLLTEQWRTRWRPNQRGAVIACDVAMAAVLMTPAAYHVDYEWSSWGEDEGWGKAASRVRLRVGFDSRVFSKHIHHAEMLHQIDPRIGW